jgi:ATP-binding cassette subfamily B protein
MENNSGFKNVKHPAKISSYLALEKKDLIIVSISGVLYNVGMILGPYFEGQMAQCLFDIYKEKSTFRDMAFLALIYVISIAFVQAMRAVKRFFVRHFSNNTSLNMRHVIYRSMLRADSNQSSDSGRNSQKEVEFVADTDGSKGEKDSVEKSDKGEAESSGVDVGTLMTKAIEDVDACAEGLRKFITEIFDTGVVMIAYLAMLIYYDWRLTIISVLFSPIAYFIADRLKKPVTSASAEQKESAGKLNTSTLDRISNALTYRIYGVEKVHEEKYEERLSDYEKKSVRANIFQSSCFLQSLRFILRLFLAARLTGLRMGKILLCFPSGMSC